MENALTQFRELEEHHLNPKVRKNPKQLLADILADNFFEIGSSGRFIYRDECLVDEGIGEWEVVMTDFKVHPLSEDIVLTTYHIKNKTLVRNTLRSSIWKRIDDRWQMVFHQGTPSNASSV